jgi:tRNA pseudouridine38-40 synthase
MPRYALRLEYVGTPFAGWQRQVGQPSVQEAVEAALDRLGPGPHRIAGAGRTDAGVHATGQVAHADMARDWDPFRLGEALNHHLRPAPVVVVAVARVTDDWHARFSAVGRRYLYRIICRRAPLTHEAGLAWRVGQELDVEAMRAGAAALIGRHDFTTFRSTMCQADSPVRTLDRIAIATLPRPDGVELRIDVAARSFLHNQVRSIVGTLERVGAGAWQPDRVSQVLVARDRAACGPVAPAEGLWFTAVTYPADPFAT